MSEINLKPCPFCNNDPNLHQTGDEAYQVEPRLPRYIHLQRWYVYCGHCDLHFGCDSDYGGNFDTKEEAIEAWNRRTETHN